MTEISRTRDSSNYQFINLNIITTYNTLYYRILTIVFKKYL